MRRFVVVEAVGVVRSGEGWQDCGVPVIRQPTAVS